MASSATVKTEVALSAQDYEIVLHFTTSLPMYQITEALRDTHNINLTGVSFLRISSSKLPQVRIVTRTAAIYWAIMRIKEFNVNGTKIAIVPGRQKPAGTANESENAIKQKELSRDEQTKPGGVLAWGLIPPGRSELEPIQLQDTLKHVNIVSVACGSRHTLMLSDTGRLFSFGEGTYGQLGTGQTADTPTPFPVAGLAHIRVTQIAAGLTFSACLTETGNLFVWGTLKFDTGSESTNKLYRPFSSPLPVLIEELKRETIIQIAAGAVHLLVLTNKGRVYSWGTSTYGRLGREGAPNQFLPIHDHKFNKETHLIQTIACGDQHNVVMDQAGNVFTWGRNMNMQCGFTSERAEILKPTFLPDVSKKMIKKIVCGPRHSAALSQHGMFIWGQVVGVGGIVNRREGDVPRSVSTFEGKKITIVDIAAGGQHLVALSDAGDVYTWGLSHYGQCGLGSTEDQPVPVHVASIKQKIFKVAAGGNTTIAVSGLLSSLLSEEIGKMMNSEEYFPDACFLFSDNRKIFAHKAILACRSNRFLQNFSSYVPRSYREITLVFNFEAIGKARSHWTFPEPDALGRDIIELGNGISYEVFLSFIGFLYTDRTDKVVVSTSAELRQLATIAMEYGVTRLADVYSSKSLSAITPSTYIRDILKLIPRKDGDEQLTDDYESLSGSKPSENKSNETIEYIGDKFSDLEFIVEGTRIPVVKGLICARSDYYMKMFGGGMSESGQKTLNLSEGENPVSLDMFSALLRFLYVDRTTKDVNVLIDLLQEANRLQLPRLITICEKNIEKEVDVDTVVYVFQTAQMHGATQLKNFCAEFIATNYADVIKTEYWLEGITEDDRAGVIAIVSEIRPIAVYK